MPSSLPWARLKAALSGVKDPQDLVLKVLAGKTKQDLYDDIGMGRSAVKLDMKNPDKALHAATAEAMAGRIGAGPTRALGYGKEVVQGLGQLAQGKLNPFNPAGYDSGDIEANEAGIQAALSKLPPPPQYPSPQASERPTLLAAYLPSSRR